MKSEGHLSFNPTRVFAFSLNILHGIWKTSCHTFRARTTHEILKPYLYFSQYLLSQAGKYAEFWTNMFLIALINWYHTEETEFLVSIWDLSVIKKPRINHVKENQICMLPVNMTGKIPRFLLIAGFSYLPWAAYLLQQPLEISRVSWKH